MSAAVAAQPPPAVQPCLGPIVGQCVVLDNVSWPEYEAIGEALRDRPNLHLTFDRGRLEIMTLSQEHERFKCLIGRVVDVLAEEFRVRIGGFGSTTYKRDVLDRGLEPDQCYYHQNLPRVRGLRRIDLSRDPPPDLAIEVDVTNSSVDRMAIYSALGVPEIWRFEDETLRAYRLGAGGRYEPMENSLTFPDIRVSDLVQFVMIGFMQDDISMVEAVRAWVRNLPPRP